MKKDNKTTTNTTATTANTPFSIKFDCVGQII